MTEPTQAGRQLAADLANAARTRKGYSGSWTANHFTADGIGSAELALARLATQSIARDAELAEAKADLREIDRMAVKCAWHSLRGNLGRVSELAAKHRETDPLLIEAREIVAASDDNLAGNVRAGEWDNSHIVTYTLAALKRGIELATNPSGRGTNAAGELK